jgi:polyferredoxin
MSRVFTNLGQVVSSLLQPLRPTAVSLREISSSRKEEAGAVDKTLGPSKAGGTKASNKAAGRITELTSRDHVISPAFKLIVWLVFLLIIVLLVALILLSVHGDPQNEDLRDTLGTMRAALTASIGAILGLIGGKSL